MEKILNIKYSIMDKKRLDKVSIMPYREHGLNRVEHDSQYFHQVMRRLLEAWIADMVWLEKEVDDSNALCKRKMAPGWRLFVTRVILVLGRLSTADLG
jgi:hypothetical protein